MTNKELLLELVERANKAINPSKEVSYKIRYDSGILDDYYVAIISIQREERGIFDYPFMQRLTCEISEKDIMEENAYKIMIGELLVSGIEMTYNALEVRRIACETMPELYRQRPLTPDEAFKGIVKSED